jgi:hypothetical protein
MIQPLGVGLPYFAALPAELYRPGLIDFVEITPETICRQRPAGTAVAIEINPDQMERAQESAPGCQWWFMV